MESDVRQESPSRDGLRDVQEHSSTAGHNSHPDTTRLYHDLTPTMQEYSQCACLCHDANRFVSVESAAQSNAECQKLVIEKSLIFHNGCPLEKRQG